MRALKILTTVMGVMIVIAVVFLGVTILRRMNGPAAVPAFAAQAVLNEPDGTRIVGIAGMQDRLAVQLQGGGADRVLFLDPRTGQVLGRAALAH